MAQRPIVHLFIGLHKTGSTAIRFMLDVHRELLPQYGFYLPLATWTRYVNHAWNGGHNNIPWELFGQRTVPAYGTIADLVAEIHQHPGQQHILLTEDLDTATEAQVETLRQHLAGCDVRIIVFVRNQLDWIQSSSGEDQKWFGAQSFADWCRAHIGKDDRLDLHGLCRRWQQAFGTVTVRCYEQIQSRVFDAFLECCGAPSALRAALAERGIPRINSTHGDLPLSVIHEASRQALAAGMRASYFNATISPAILTAFKQVKQPPKRRANLEPGLRDTLVALMRSTNPRLADDFGLTLGPEYLNPAIDAVETTSGSAAISVEDCASLILASCADVSVRTGARLRPAASADAARGTTLACEATALADRTYPWAASSDAGNAELDRLLQGVAADRFRLYLERKGNHACAFRQPDGRLEKIADLDAGQWVALRDALIDRAHLNTASWNNVREGEVLVSAQEPVRLWLRSAPTDSGELIVIEPLDRAQEQARLDLASPAAARTEDAQALLDMVSAAINAGHWDDPSLPARLTQALRINPDLAPAYHLLGLLAERRRAFDEAAHWLTQAVAHKPSFGNWFDLGRVRLALGQSDAAINPLEQAIACEPSKPLAHHMLGMVQLERGSPASAVPALEQAVALNPTESRWHYDLGLAYFRVENYADAAVALCRAIDLQPTWAPAVHLFAHTMRELYGELAALSLYERTVALDGSVAAAHYDLGRLNGLLGDHRTAIECLTRAVGLNPKEPRWLYELGAGKFHSGDYAGATLALWRVVKALPEWAPAVHLLAHSVKRQEGTAAALPIYERAVALDTASAAANYDLGHTRFELGDIAGSIPCFERAVAAKPDTAQWRFELGRAQFLTGDNRGAENSLQQALTAQPAWPEAAHLLAHAVRRERGDAASLPFYERVVALDSNNAFARYDLGMVQSGLGNHQAAIIQLERATTLNPNETLWGIDLGRAQLEVGNLASAERWLRQTVAALPESGAATHLLAHAVKRQRGAAAALPLYERVVALEPNNACACYDLGLIRYEQGEYAAAIPSLQRAATISPDWAEAHYYLGLATCGAHGPARALAHLETAAAIKPSWAEARYELAMRVLRTGGPRAAQAHFEMATELAPTWAQPWRQAGACARAMERWAEATRLFKAAFDLGLCERALLSDLADAACRTAQFSVAVDALRTLVPIAPKPLAVEKHLGICLRLVGELAESEQLLAKCVASDPGWAGARFELGMTLVAQGRNREGRNEIKRASELQPDWTAPRDVLRDLESRVPLRLAS